MAAAVRTEPEGAGRPRPLAKRQVPSVDTSISGTDDLRNLTVEFASGELSVHFFRRADTGDTVGDIVLNVTLRTPRRQHVHERPRSV